MPEIEQLEFSVQLMTCDSCALHVEKAFRRVPGVESARVPDWRSGRATVVAEAGVEAKSLAAAAQEAGYTAILKARRAVKPTGKPSTPIIKQGDQPDLMVIGGGSAGFAAAIKGAELGYRVTMVEAGTIGGTCVNIGCVPSKTLIRSVEQYHLAGQPRFKGVHTQPGTLDWSQAIVHKDELVAEMRQAKYVDVLAAYPEIKYLQGRAHLMGKNFVEIDGKGYTPGKIIVATGASPWAPPVPGLDEAGYLTSTTALELRELPRSMLVLGANAVGLELAQTFARAGVYVTVLELLPRIAPFEDEEISVALAGYLEEQGLHIMPGFKTSRVETRDGRYLLTGMMNDNETNFEAERLLVATGRRPNTAGMGLEKAGVALDKNGEILVDETLQTSNPFVYAAGDVIGRDMFVYVAAYAGGLAAENALAGTGRVYNTSYIPRVTFTDPQIASAGLTEAQAHELGYDVKVSKLPMSYMPRAQVARDTRGLIKLVADVATDRLLGAHILAPEAGEMIQIASLAMRFGITVRDLQETMFPYLTSVEGLRLAALSFDKDPAMLSCCAA